MLEAEGIIEKVGKKHCWIKIPRQHIPIGCGRLCAGCAGCKEHGPGFLRIRVARPQEKTPKTGDKVLVNYTEPKQSTAALALFGLPLGGLLLFGWLATLINKSDAFYILGNGLGLVIGCLLIWLIDSFFPGLFLPDGEVIKW